VESNKSFYFKNKTNYNLSDESILEISNNELRLKDLGEYYSDNSTLILLHMNDDNPTDYLRDTNNVTGVTINSAAGTIGTYNLTHLYSGSDHFLKWGSGDPVQITGDGIYSLYTISKDSSVEVYVDLSALPNDNQIDAVVVYDYLIQNSAKWCSPEDITDGNLDVVLLDPKLANDTYNLIQSGDSVNGFLIFGKNSCNGESFRATYGSASLDADYALGATANTGSSSAVASSGKLTLTHGFVNYEINKNANFTQLGSIALDFKPLSLPAMGNEYTLFTLQASQSLNEANRITAYINDSGEIRIKFYNFNTDLIFDGVVHSTSLAASTSYTLIFKFDLDEDKLYVSVDGSEEITAITNCKRTVDNSGFFVLGSNLAGADTLHAEISWITIHRNYLLDSSYTLTSNFSPSGSKTKIGTDLEYELYADIDEEILQTGDSRVIVKPNSVSILPSANTYNITVDSKSSQGDVTKTFRSGTTTHYAGLFNSYAFYFNGVSNYVYLKYETFDILDDSPFTVDFATNLDTYRDIASLGCIIENIDYVNKEGFAVYLNGNASRLYLYKQNSYEYAYINIPASKRVKLNNYYRWTIMFDASTSEIEFYLNAELLTDVRFGEVTQPINISGVEILGTTHTYLGSKSLAYDHTGQTIQFDGGSTINISVDGYYEIPSLAGGGIQIKVISNSLPKNTVSELVTINAYFDLSSFKNSTKDYYIGSYNATSYFFKGGLDELRLSKYRRTVKDLFNTKTSTESPYAVVSQAFTPGNLTAWLNFSAHERVSAFFESGVTDALAENKLIDNDANFDSTYTGARVLNVDTNQYTYAYFTGSTNKLDLNADIFVKNQSYEIFKNPGKIGYQISANGGTSFHFYNTVSEIWSPVVNAEDYNSVTELQENLNKLDTNIYKSLVLKIILIAVDKFKYASLLNYGYAYSVVPLVDNSIPNTFELRKNSAYTLEYDSRYQYGDMYIYEDINFLDGRTVPIFSSDPTDKTFVVTSAEDGRWDLISLTLYGTNKYWWILMDLNAKFDPFEKLGVGTIIKYPVYERLVDI